MFVEVLSLLFWISFVFMYVFVRFFSHQDVNVNLMEATADDGSFKTDRCSLECLTIRRTLSFDELTTWFIQIDFLSEISTLTLALRKSKTC